MNVSSILIIGNYRISVGGERWEIKLFCYGQLHDKVRNIEAKDELHMVLNVKVKCKVWCLTFKMIAVILTGCFMFKYL